MGNPLLAFWHRVFVGDHEQPPMPTPAVSHHLPVATAAQASDAIFLILRRMRIPLIVLIVIFAVSVLGLTLVPGQDGAGRPARLGFFDAFYVMSYTATTIGFGELPHTFTDAQRMWVTLSIFLTVIGWAYAIGSLLGLLQDRGFRRAVALQRFHRTVGRLREPFLLLAGYGQTGERLGRSLDALGRRFVVLDRSDSRVDVLDLGAYRADVPGLVGDASNPGHLIAAGLDHRYCEGVLALTDDDEVNLAVAMTAALLRPDLPVIARTVSPSMGQRMAAYGTPAVINPFDRFGDHLCLALRAPSSYRLLRWLTSPPGTAMPGLLHPPDRGRWVVCGYGRFGKALTADLRAEGLQVAVVDPGAGAGPESERVVAHGEDSGVMAQADVAHAVGFVAGTGNDTANLSLVMAARQANPDVFVVARQNDAANAPLFRAMHCDALLVQTEVVAREARARLVAPLLWRFLQEMPARGDAWAADVVDRLATHCGRHVPTLWKVQLTEAETPALVPWLSRGGLRLGDLMRNPEDREQRLAAVPLMVARGEDSLLLPDDDLVLQAADQLLLAGRSSARRSLEAAMLDEASVEYVVSGRLVPSGWVWRWFARSRPAAGRAQS